MINNLTGSVVIKRINDHIYKFEGFNPYDKLFDVNAVCINEENDVLFIDCGFNNACSKLMWEFALNKFPNFSEKRKFLILTHHHLDHSFGMDYFQQKEIEIIGHQEISQFFKNDNGRYVKAAYEVRYPNELPKTIFDDVKLTVPAILVSKDKFLEKTNKKIKILQTPGHSPDSISIFHPPTKTIITGDSMFQQPTSPTIPMAKVPKHILDESIKKIRSMKPKTIIQGH